MAGIFGRKKHRAATNHADDFLCFPNPSFPMSFITRRSFLHTSALATGAALLARSTSSYARTVGANNRLRIAVVGLNGRGKAHIAGWSEQKDVEIAYLIDPDHFIIGALSILFLIQTVFFG
jgi:hypothetical protein